MHNGIPRGDNFVEIIALKKIMIDVPFLGDLKAGDILFAIIAKHIDDRLIETHQRVIAPKHIEKICATAAW